jgi:hypothetical protein
MRILSLSFVAMLAFGLGSGCSSSLGSSDGGSGGSGTGTGGSGTGTGGAGGEGGDVTCSPACGNGTICVGTGTQGGVQIMASDAGVCPSGRHRSGDTCITDLSYACMPIPAGCGGAVTCTCASSLCPSQHTCAGPSGGILTCIESVP